MTTPDLRSALERELVPWFKVRGDDSLDQGILRRCLLCGRLGRIVSSTASPDGLTHEPDCAFEAALRAALASQPEPLDVERLARALVEVDGPGYWAPGHAEEYARHVAAALSPEPPAPGPSIDTETER